MDTNASVSLLKEDLAGRIRVPAANRLQILEEFDRSGMSGLAFAALVGVKYRNRPALLSINHKFQPLKNAKRWNHIHQPILRSVINCSVR